MDSSDYIQKLKAEKVRATGAELERMKQEMKNILQQCPEKPLIPYEEDRAAARLMTARSYLEHAGSLIYSGGGQTFLTGESIRDPAYADRGNIDCSTYMLLVLCGVDYADSPYQTGQPVVDSGRMSPQTDPVLINALCREEPIRYASELAQYFWDRGRCFRDADEARPGDLVFFQTGKYIPYYVKHNRFLAIAHVGILTGDRAHILESSGSLEKRADRPGVKETALSGKLPVLVFAR